MALTIRDKTKIYNILADAYLEAMKRQLIGRYEQKVLAKKILEKIEVAQTTQDVIQFIDELLMTYPAFSFAKTIFSNEISKMGEKKIINQLQGFIKNIKS